ncbi:30S ribosomal protein S13 [Candidatus Uhrbacteria bacterium RIFCSPHIGHO2_02_FULL_60_10]|uniref:Small ribosomal subunit protein uS13 n=1 Tax=Candidatus Uhrbacteria bacterium RIFCSPHIGHO2_02_FULL_60_10 TaxID=1802392 RepID=A0A1F7U5H1_9BACT|nr:MAG: 30S ribosomal protein S13 [Candidatus Uhrbacteria bacterium RIFCSPHIGHO2_02_FULL_60_10]
MARIAGITLPNKRIEIALTYVYGIGRSRSAQILSKLKINKDTRANDLTEADTQHLREEIEKNLRVEGELRRDVQASIKRLRDIGSYRGSRHAKGLPVRGQRTKTNSRTVRGNVRRTMGSGRTKAEKT